MRRHGKLIRGQSGVVKRGNIDLMLEVRSEVKIVDATSTANHLVSHSLICCDFSSVLWI